MLIAAAVLVLISSIAFAQTTVQTGSIVGTVADPSGAAVPNAKVVITNTGTGQATTLNTNSAGVYNSGSLVPGVYKVQVSAKGFSSATETLTVQVSNTANGDIRLQLGQESTVVEVQASQLQVNTEQATVQGVLTANQIETLPVNGRNFLDLAQLEPGVQIQDGENFDPTKVGYSSISFGGRFGRTARISVDGVDVSDETVGTTTEDIPASGIQEFSLAQSNLDLSNDLTSSGAVNVTTKSGTNNIHGEAFGLFRDSSVGSAKLLQPINPASGAPIHSSFQRNQEGGNLGGPLIKDKLFFFADGERTLQHLAAPVAESAPFEAFSGTFPSPFKEDELMGRLDYNLSQNARLFGRFNYFQNSVLATFFPSSFQRYQNKDYTRNTVVGLDFNAGGLTNSVRFSFLKFQNQIVDATRGSSLPFANYPVSINIGTFTVGPNLLAPQSTPQSDHQLKYDGSKVIGKHIIRFGVGWNHIQGGGFASFFKVDPQVFVVGTPGSGDPTAASLDNAEVVVGNGQGFSTTQPALGFPAGGLGPDNRLSLYIGDTWKVRHNLTITPGLRWSRDTGRTDSDLPAIPELNAAFPGFGNRIRQANTDFGPQLGLVWDPRGNGKTSIRAGIGLFYENVIFNNVLFDRPLRLRTGAFLQFPPACLFGSALPVPTTTAGTITVDSVQGIDPTSPSGSYCDDTIANSAAALASFEATYQADNPFSLTTPNPAFIGNQICAPQGTCSASTAGSDFNIGSALFAPNYKTPRSVQMNLGIQHEIRRGMIFSADFVRNVETHSLLGVDVNHGGAARTFNQSGAMAAIAATNGAFGCAATSDPSCAIAAGATINDFASFGLGSPGDLGGSCQPLFGYSCAFPGNNPAYGSIFFLEPIGRSVYNALQLKLVENVANPMRGMRRANLQVSYSLSRFENPLGFQGTTPPSNPVSSNDQDFVLTASDNDHPLRYMGPSLLDRTHQISFGGSFDVPSGFRFGIIGHFYSPLASPAIVGNTGNLGDIFQTDFTGSGTGSNPLPGTKNGSFMRDFGLAGLNGAIDHYNSTVANQPTPAGQMLIQNGLFTLAQLQAIGAVAPSLATAPSDQLTFPWLRAFDFRLSWVHTFHDRFTIEPSVGVFNIFNFANFNLPPGTISGWLSETCPLCSPGSSSINTTHTITQAGETGPESNTFRVGNGTGVFGLGSPRVMEWGLRVSF
jgi:hypothetical protein